MALNTVASWDGTNAANNTDIGGLPLSDTTPIDSLDNIVRELMKQIKSGVAVLSEAGTFTAAQTIAITDPGVTGATFSLYHNSVSPIIADAVGSLIFDGNDSGGTRTEYGSIVATIRNPASGSESGFISHRVAIGGALTTMVGLDGDGPEIDIFYPLDISASTAGQIKFPTTQNPSTSTNILDDYREGTWTPSFTFETPGNLNRSFSSQAGTYTKVGNTVVATFNMVTSVFTHTTAAGALNITGLPFTSANSGVFCQGALSWGGITKASYTSVQAVLPANSSVMICQASGSGVSLASIAASDMPTGGTVQLRGTITFQASA